MDQEIVQATKALSIALISFLILYSAVGASKILRRASHRVANCSSMGSQTHSVAVKWATWSLVDLVAGAFGAPVSIWIVSFPNSQLTRGAGNLSTD